MSSEIIKVLEYLAQKLGIAVDWTSSNVMPYVEQICEKYIMWEISTSFAWMGIGAVILIATIGIFFPMNKAFRKDIYSNGLQWPFLIVGTLLAMCMICEQVFDIIECKVFPEKAIYEYIQYVLNSN